MDGRLFALLVAAAWALSLILPGLAAARRYKRKAGTKGQAGPSAAVEGQRMPVQMPLGGLPGVTITKPPEPDEQTRPPPPTYGSPLNGGPSPA